MKKLPAPPGSKSAASRGGAGGESVDLTPAVVVLRHPIEFQDRMLAEIVLAVPTSKDLTELSPDLVACRRDVDASLIMAFDRALIMSWLVRLSGLSREALGRMSLDDAANLVEALSILLARASFTVMKKN